MNQSQLVEAVRSVTANEKVAVVFDAATTEAMRLSDLYDYIRPTDYVLPLDAMAGHPITAFRA